jgi:hypothetical protein
MLREVRKLRARFGISGGAALQSDELAGEEIRGARERDRGHVSYKKRSERRVPEFMDPEAYPLH